MPRTRRSTKKPVEEDEPEVNGVESESEEVSQDDEEQEDVDAEGDDGEEEEQASDEDSSEQDGESEPSTPSSRRRPILSAGFYPSGTSPARTPYRRNLFGAERFQPLKTPPHTRKNPFLKRGYQIYENPQQCLRTFNEVNNETSNVYACLFGIVLLFVLNLNIGWVMYGSNLGVDADVRFLHVGILVAIFSLVGKLLYHLYIPLPEYFNFWSAVNLLSINLSIAAVLLTLWGLGYPVDHFAKLDALPLVPALRESISVEWWLVAAALTVTAAASFAIRLNSRTVLTPLWLKVLDTSVGLFFMVPFVMKARGNQIRGSLFLALYLLAAIFHQFKLPERFSPRRFDIYGNSRNLYIILHVLALYVFFSDQFIAKTGLGDRLWDSYLFCE